MRITLVCNVGFVVEPKVFGSETLEVGTKMKSWTTSTFHLLVMHFHVCLFMQYIDCVYHRVRDSKVFDVPTLDNFGVEL